jgi:hypothetical protein
MNDIELHPSLAEVVHQAKLDVDTLRAGLRLGANGKPEIADQHEVYLTDGAGSAIWKVPSVRALFRGDTVPPSFSQEPPFEYQPLFRFVEEHAVLFCKADGDKTDGEFEEAYSNLRRRPDGKPFSLLHKFMWQAGAVLAGRSPVSQAEFEALFGRLAISAATFRIGVVSRNYIDVIRRY